jgi:hypothetical protein
MHASADEMFDQYLLYIDFIKELKPNFVLSDTRTMLEHYPVEDMIGFSELQNTVGFGNSEDIKPYVPVVTLDEYVDRHDSLQKELPFYLWPYALLVTDGFRYFSHTEIDKLYNIKNIANRHKLENRYKTHLKRMIKNHEYKYY